MNVELVAEGTGGGDPSTDLWNPVFGLVQRQRDLEEIRCFFFTWKPPGIRLRFELAGGKEAAHEIESCLGELVDRGVLSRWYPSVYEAETFMFGGPEAMDAVHPYFFADSTGWWRWDAISRCPETMLDPRLLSVSVLNDLFVQFTDGPEEVWDVWCHVATLHGDAPTGGGPPVGAPMLADLVDQVGPSEQAVLRAYEDANAELTRRFRALHSAGRLLHASRLVLPHLAVHHWNRYRFSAPDRASMYTPMIRAWSPHE